MPQSFHLPASSSGPTACPYSLDGISTFSHNEYVEH